MTNTSTATHGFEGTNWKVSELEMTVIWWFLPRVSRRLYAAGRPAVLAPIITTCASLLLLIG